MPSHYGVKLYVWGDYALFSRPEMKSERVSYDVITPSAARAILESIYWKPAIRWRIDSIRVLKPIEFTNIRKNEVSGKMVSPSKALMQGEVASEEGALEEAGGEALDTKKKKSDVGIFIEENRQQRASLLLKDVAYLIEAHLEVLDNKEKDGTVLACPEAKHLDSFLRRAKQGKCFQHPYFGCREYAAHFEVYEEGKVPKQGEDVLVERNKDLGIMFYDWEYVPSKKGKISMPRRSEKFEAIPHFFRAKMEDGLIKIPPFSQTLS